MMLYREALVEAVTVLNEQAIIDELRPPMYWVSMIWNTDSRVIRLLDGAKDVSEAGEGR
jgi:hypothetical protein